MQIILITTVRRQSRNLTKEKKQNRNR